ncbi:MAG: 16S rRNA (guanine(966)-N(2))-methyltransferase RsmD [Hyphomicrobiaceae bacterium]|nr:16S rRNA (guanine(966)-N(2))-methyltransferase RsmD [Hyphomicrobiaceae bacterium]
MRIVGGTHRGRILLSPKDNTVRPTSNKVRGAIFNILLNGKVRFNFNRAYVLDLFAGTGAFGCEALSRGAEFCTFVENAQASRMLVQKNIANLNFKNMTRVLTYDATQLGSFVQTTKSNIIFIDAPYSNRFSTLALVGAMKGGWLANHALIVIEDKSGESIVLPTGVKGIDYRIYGKTQVIIARYTN